MLRIAGLAGNRGRNLMHIADLAPGGAEVAAVLTDHESAPVLSAAADRGIPTEVVERGDDARADHEVRVQNHLDDYEFDLVCMDGYMRVLSGEMLETLPTVLNVHPSLLPAFRGENAHEQALAAGVRTTGCTVHVATEDLDRHGLLGDDWAGVEVLGGDASSTRRSSRRTRVQ